MLVFLRVIFLLYSYLIDISPYQISSDAVKVKMWWIEYQSL